MATLEAAPRDVSTTTTESSSSTTAVSSRFNSSPRTALHSPDVTIDTDSSHVHSHSHNEEQEHDGGGRFDCNICLESVSEPVVTFCGHLYCWSCLYRWLEPGLTHEERAGLVRNTPGYTHTHTQSHTSSSHEEGEDGGSMSVGAMAAQYYSYLHGSYPGSMRSTSSSSSNGRRCCPVCKKPCSVKTLVPIYVRSDSATHLSASKKRAGSVETKVQQTTEEDEEDGLEELDQPTHTSQQQEINTSPPTNPQPPVVEQATSQEDSTQDQPIHSFPSGLRRRRTPNEAPESTSTTTTTPHDPNNNNNNDTPTPVPSRPLPPPSSTNTSAMPHQIATAAQNLSIPASASTTPTITTAANTSTNTTTTTRPISSHEVSLWLPALLGLTTSSSTSASAAAAAAASASPRGRRFEEDGAAATNEATPALSSSFTVGEDATTEFLSRLLLMLGSFVVLCLLLF